MEYRIKVSNPQNVQIFVDAKAKSKNCFLCIRGIFMDTVYFIHTEDDGKDIVLGFSLDESGSESFCFHRTPMFEDALMPHERGPVIEWTDDDVVIVVRLVKVNRKELKIEASDKSIYDFDLSRIDDEDYNDMITILTKMNFDNIFKLEVS